MRRTFYLGIINVIPNLDWILLTDFAYCLCVTKIVSQFVQHSNFGENIDAKQVLYEDSGIYTAVLAYNDNSHLETDQVKRLHEKNTTLRIRDVYPGSDFFPSRIRIKE
jgi:hypothetical protein